MTHHELVLLGRAALAFGLCFVIGFERELRGSPAGDRTYALIGLAAAAITGVTEIISPQAIAGITTGIGFIGGGLVFREGFRNIRGITSAATILAAAGIGIVSGTGHWLLAILVAGLVLVDLELRNIPVLRFLDARRYVGRARDDMATPMGMKDLGPDTHPRPE
jgi:putative Mg2+ transporter-C (MgtC) family protein